MKTIRSALQKAKEILAVTSETPRLDAELLLCFVTHLQKTQLITDPEIHLTKREIKRFKALIESRASGKPIAYIIGKKEFWNFDLLVTPDVLIPRPETECLIEWVLEKNKLNNEFKMADLGVGSAAVALAFAKERNYWQIHATDRSEKALKVARKNKERYCLKNIEFFKGNWCDALPDIQYDLIVSNPPYIPENDIHLEQLRFEPIEALTSGKEGLDDIMAIIKQAKKYLKIGGQLVFEHGYNQSKAVTRLLKSENYTHISIHKDLSGLPRFASAIF